MKRVNALLNRSVPIKGEPSLTPAENRLFEHKPLDETQSSIRLVTLSSELSADGSIQCYVSHSTLDRASYVCLSYRWGPPGDEVRIHINGAPFYIRKNLFGFLDMVRRMPMTFYWIDAMCIDQTNISERNHQVAQMGQIFSRAFLVYAWLGKSPSMTPWMQHFVETKNPYTLPANNPWTCIFEARETVQNCVFNNAYWSRAWVTQEILLARSVSVLVCRESFKFHELVDRMHCFDHRDFGSFRHCTFAKFADTIGDSEKLRSKTLISLLDKFRDKECEFPRDRIYSLLSICSEFQLPEVDYGQSDEDLAYDILNRSDEPLCVCSALLVAQTLCLSNRQLCNLDVPTRTDSSTFIEFDVTGLRFARHAMLCNDQIHSWAHYKLMGTDIFGHDHLFSDFCPAFDTLMDAIQACAIKMAIEAPLTMDDETLQRTDIPFILKTMDDGHALAILNFGPAFTVKSHDTNPDTCTIQVALQLLAELLPQPTELCPRIAHRKERNSEEATSMSKKGTYQQEGTNRRKWSMETRRVDSANPTKRHENEGPISRLGLRRLQYKE